MPYYKQTIDDKVVSKACAASLPEGEGWELIEGDPALIEVYQEPVVSYNEDDLIEWAYANVFTADLVPHLAAFLSFARKASQKSADIFRTYAVAMGLGVVAETIIAKAIELGADIIQGGE